MRPVPQERRRESEREDDMEAVLGQGQQELSPGQVAFVKCDIKFKGSTERGRKALGAWIRKGGKGKGERHDMEGKA